jgi:hypothetical protein
MQVVASGLRGVVVEFSAVEVVAAEAVATRRRRRHRKAGHASLWVDNGDDPYRTEALGLMAEQATAFVLGIPYDLSRDAEGSGKPFDLERDGLKIEVKYADGPSHRLIFAKRNPFKADADAAVLVVPCGERRLRVVGYTTHANFERHMVVRDFGHGFGDEQTLDQERLLPITGLTGPPAAVHVPVHSSHPDNPYHHTKCTRCGGYLQGTREVVGICLNCEEHRGWAVDQAPDKSRWKKR